MINLNGVIVETEEQLEHEIVRQGIPANQRQAVRNAFHKIYTIPEEEPSNAE
jgi:hypothetical protein